MAYHTDHDDIIAHARRIASDMCDPDVGPLWHYRELTARCQAEPEQMAQVVMFLALLFPYEMSNEELAARIQVVTDIRLDAVRDFDERCEVVA